MLRTFKCTVLSNPRPIHITNENGTIDLTLDGSIRLECFYQVYDDQKFKLETSYDISNAIHRNKIETEIKNFIIHKLSKIPIEAGVDGLENRKKRELEIEIESSIQQFHLIKNGLSFIDIRIIQIEYKPSVQKKLDEQIHLQDQVDTIDDIENEFNIFFQEFKEPKEDKWICSCGKLNTTNFCPNCGEKRESHHKKINLKL